MRSYPYADAAATGLEPFEGWFGVYGGGGYVVDLPDTQAGVRALLARMEQDARLDRTRARALTLNLALALTPTLTLALALTPTLTLNPNRRVGGGQGDCACGDGRHARAG